MFGTRPEAVKMAPVVRACDARRDELEAVVCTTGQHRELLQPVIDYFRIAPDIDLDLMAPGEPMAEVASRTLAAVSRVIADVQPHYVVVQGDTTTAAMASLAAFYRRTPLVHVEAGLRTGRLDSPWPEEFHRRLASLAATLHCCPTRSAADNLLSEGVDAGAVIVTGNTVVDALDFTLARERTNEQNARQLAGILGSTNVLITCHRRESFGGPLVEICSAIAELGRRFPDVSFILPVHPNPRVRGPVEQRLQGRGNIHLIDPLPYPQFVWLMAESTLILTDSGGVQEEAPSLRKPVVVMRGHTERNELLDAGGAVLAGTDADAICEHTARLLTDEQHYRSMQITENPFGDGRAAPRIVDCILSHWQARHAANFTNDK